MSKIKMIPCLYLQAEKAVTGFGQRNLLGSGDILELSRKYTENGADELLIFDFSSTEEEHERAIRMIKRICAAGSGPCICAGHIQRLEDVKKLIYAGASKVVLNFSKASNVALLPEASQRFGREKILACVSAIREFTQNQSALEQYACGILALDSVQDEIARFSTIPVLLHTDLSREREMISLLKKGGLAAISGNFISNPALSIRDFKVKCKDKGIEVCFLESAVAWEEFKLGSDGLIPVVVQDDQTDEVLMVAYMNREAFEMTLQTGRMTYFSRSRQELWIKGMTSGHFQYVKSLKIDCDKDTLLARVEQIGAACHTGNHSCFFTTLAAKETNAANPLKVFQNVYDVIVDRKEHPKEGSYTNYLFDKGTDKILKKVGEECTEIVIAAKNPDPEEIKYEISDFLYHIMVLMVEKGITWEDITGELARRE
ncbi:MAG: bifunctional phosphoribosyl-AMP cyclohydrolase/phosphoribosyl-ATP diphosphatase HisIE [Blautia sp.]|nr:bifunctional phosphoribosyl-AMP cyclohydrolase/phosphoribosyl-ATP diphosphatase HisIE [Blautia sp.]